MASSASHMIIVILLVLAVSSALFSPAASTWRSLDRRPEKNGFRVSLRHVDSGGNYTKFERLQRAVKRGRLRLQRLSAKTASFEPSVEAPVHAGNGEFLMNLAIGTPAETYSAIMDTGSDLIWTQCKPCKVCFDQPTPIFDPEKSSSFSKLPCSSDLYHSSTQGVLATETFTFGDASVSKIGFGCGEDNRGRAYSQGAGLFISQMKLDVDASGSTELELCFTLPPDGSPVDVPQLVFHFEGVDLKLPKENYIIEDSALRVICLTMGSSSGMSIFGNFQQQNIVDDLYVKIILHCYQSGWS
ncbi:unnamed protein product, partial [Vitis vinifera]